MSVCGCSLGNSPHVGAPWRTVPRVGMWVLLGVQPPFGQVLHGVRPLVPHSHEPSRQAPPGRRPGCQPLFSRRRARAVGAGAGGCRTWACDPGAVPSLRPEGTKEATSPSRPGEGGGAEQPTEWMPLQPYSPQEPGRAGLHLGPPGPPWSLPRASATGHICPYVPGPRFPGGQAEPGRVTAVWGGGGHTPATSDPRVGRTRRLCA